MIAESKLGERDHRQMIVDAALNASGELELHLVDIKVLKSIQGRTIDSPITIASLMREVPFSEREIKAVVRKLRRRLLPIGSSKGGGLERPAGYYWIRTEDEMRAYFDEASKQPLDELTTLHRMVRANHPRLAGQLRLTFDEQESA